MKQFCWLLAIVLVSPTVFSQANNGNPNFRLPSPSIKTVVLQPSDDGNRYFVVFSARGDTDLGTSPTGHAFVAWGTENQGSQMSSYQAYGFYPKDRSKKGNKLSAVSAMPVAGEIVNEDEMHSVLATTDSLVVEVDRDGYTASLGIARMLSQSPPKFRLLTTDCVGFLSMIASYVGMTVPPRTPLNSTPHAFVRDLIRAATTPVTINANGISYTGQAYNGLPNGQGTFKYPNGNKFEGQVRQGRPTNGTMRYPSGNSYTGPFDKELNRTGQGKYTWTDGSSFEGKFENNGLANGKETFPDGSTYNGEFHNNLREGHGTFQFPDGESFDGTYQGGHATQGTYHFKNGNKQSGTLTNGRFEGQTEFVRADGTRYVGGWKDFKANGQGTVSRPDGTSVSGTWKDGDLQRAGATVRDANGRERGFSPKEGGDSDVKGEKTSFKTDSQQPDRDMGRVDGDAPIKTPASLN